MKILRIVGWIATAMLALAACRGATAEGLRAYKTGDELARALRDAGAQVAETALKGHAALSSRTRILQVDQALVHVYEYESKQDRQRLQDLIAPDVSAVGETALDWPKRPNLWASGRLIVIYPGSEGGVILLLSGLLGDPLTAPTTDVDEPFPPAVTVAIGMLAERMEVEPAEIIVLTYEAVAWPDSCLGFPDADEACAEVITPGWKIVLQANGETYKIHTDVLGEQVRGRP